MRDRREEGREGSKEERMGKKAGSDHGKEVQRRWGGMEEKRQIVRGGE